MSLRDDRPSLGPFFEIAYGYREGMCLVCAGSAGPVAPLASKLLVLSKKAIACICMGYAWAIRWPRRSRKLTGTERGGRPRSTTAASHVYYFTLFKVLSRCRSRKLTGTERGARSRSTTASSHVFYFTLFKVEF